MSLPASYFDDFYGDREDPWGFTERWYEQRKFALTMAALPRARYRSAFEPGCSVGVLTAMLAQRCDHVLATDVAQAALDQAARRVPSNVELRRWSLGESWDERTHDLVVLSEVAYYLDEADLAGALAEATSALEPGGTLVAVHWRHRVSDYPQTGDGVHAQIRTTPGLALVASYADDDLLLDVFERSDAPVASVAAREGLA
ncbi:MAG: class I SAM-dependent methyltransferase [Mycobacteriaceae bacterium]